MTHVMDTHALVWFLNRSPRLSPGARDALGDPTAQVVIPTIVLAEIAFLYARKRITVDLHAVMAHIASTTNCIVYPLDEAVVERLPAALDIHDAIIVATALVFRDALGTSTSVVTKDGDIVASGLVNVTW